ncbi:bifunctional diaminohydroxyphosphoribosylaminopyrimidine deaminase/5-amino-6-(5-phosphoribosylamino)uracil reductase RibD [Desulfolithobacter sp.]
MQEDEIFMQMALAEAVRGQGRTSPNPCVGAVVVRDGEVVGRGYHRKAGTPHAEVHALSDAGNRCQGATIYVTLEPCNHTGRTPPCSRAILEAGIRRVVIGMLDPHGLAGGGAAFLASRGLEVTTGVLEKRCREINYPFIKHVTTGLPWVVMKAAMSLDGRISYLPGGGGRITGSEASQFVHRLRDRFDAILIGAATARIDNPSLTTRLEGARGRDPLRVILDSNLSLSPDGRFFNLESPAQTWIFCRSDVSVDKEQRLAEAGAVVHRVAFDDEGRLVLEEVLKVLGRSDITSVLVEGGSRIHGSFLGHSLVDQVYLFTAPFFIGDQGTPLLQGYSFPATGEPRRLRDMTVERVGADVLIQGLLTTV